MPQEFLGVSDVYPILKQVSSEQVAQGAKNCMPCALKSQKPLASRNTWGLASLGNVKRLALDQRQIDPLVEYGDGERVLVGLSVIGDF